MRRAHVVLIPGLLGFERLGLLRYFTDVEGPLREPFEQAGVDVKISVTDPPPTAPIEVRAARLVEQIAERTTDEPLLLVGHSTGGLDCRVITSPGVSLPTRTDVEAVAGRIRGVVTHSSPHYGAPLARATTGISGHRLLSGVARLLAQLLRVHGRTRLQLIEPAKLALHLARLAGIDKDMRARLREALAEAMRDQPEGIHPEIIEWLGEIGGDSTLLEQLTPRAVARLRADLRPRPQMRTGSVVVMAPPPRLQSVLAWRIPPYARATAALYQVIYRLAGSMRRDETPELSPDNRQVMLRGLGRVPQPGDNDGLVPTLSQVWGEVIAAVQGDHLDLMGYYGGAPGAPRLDMLNSRAPFDWEDFATVWRQTGSFLLASL